jgi:3-oxoacyl-[acyl-carrier-protein] synthase III
MALFSTNQIRIAGISCCVPKRIISNKIASDFISEEVLAKIMATTGIEERRITDNKTTADYCEVAAEKLLNELKWERSEIGILVFISQTPDYTIPMTSTILQHKLGIPTTCIAFDSTLGCSGYTYGLSILSTMMQSSKIAKGLLLVGDTISKITSPKDRSTYPLFGDAGTATAIEYKEHELNEIYFELGSDGGGSDAIKVEAGGARSPMNSSSLEAVTYEDGSTRNKCQLYLNGIDVFNFGINQAPKSVKSILEFAAKNIDDIDFFVFHQANKLMNDMIRKKLKIVEEKVPSTLSIFGNTSSATIPLTIAYNLREQLRLGRKKILMCGFGVGLSWSTVIADLDHIVCPDIIEI